MLPVQPRVLRANQAPAYLGMSRAEFNRSVRPFVREIIIGTQGVGFDRHELDAWLDSYIGKAEDFIAADPTPSLSRRKPGRKAKSQITISPEAAFKAAVDAARRGGGA